MICSSGTKRWVVAQALSNHRCVHCLSQAYEDLTEWNFLKSTIASFCTIVASWLSFST